MPSVLSIFFEQVEKDFPEIHIEAIAAKTARKAYPRANPEVLVLARLIIVVKFEGCNDGSPFSEVYDVAARMNEDGLKRLTARMASMKKGSLPPVSPVVAPDDLNDMIEDPLSNPNVANDQKVKPARKRKEKTPDYKEWGSW